MSSAEATLKWFPEVSARGKTAEEALKNVKMAIKDQLESQLDRLIVTSGDTVFMRFEVESYIHGCACSCSGSAGVGAG